MTVPTQGETFSKLLEHLRLAQEDAATLAHLASANDDRVLAAGWLAISELFSQVQKRVTHLATRGLQ